MMLFETPAQSSVAQRSVATLEDYLDAIKNRKWLVIGCTVLGLAGAFYATKDRIAYYEASADVLLNPSPVGRADGQFSNPNLERESRVLSGEETTKEVLSTLGLERFQLADTSISTSFIPQSDVLTLTVSSPSPDKSARVANAYVTEFVQDRNDQQAAVFDSLISSLQTEVDDSQVLIDQYNAEIADLNAQRDTLIDQQPSVERNDKLSDLSTRIGQTSGQLSSEQSSQRNSQSKLNDIARSRDASRPSAEVLTAAEPPDGSTGLPRVAFLIAGLLFGFILGVILAFLRERLDRKASSSREVELALGGSVVGTVPKFGLRQRRGSHALVMANDKSGVAIQRAREAYRRLRSSVLFLARTDNARAIVVTSTKPLEGKSTTSANLAISLALGGTRTVLVSADLRRPSLEGLFGIRNERGLSSYLTGKTETVHTERLEGIESLTIIPAGPEIPNPGELLGSPRFERLMALLLEHYDVVIIDSPPLGAAADSLAAAESADGVLIVVDGNRTETTELLAIRRELDRAGVRLLGAVLNREAVKRTLPFRSRRYGYYGTGDVDRAMNTAAYEGDAAPVLHHSPAGPQNRSIQRNLTPSGGIDRSSIDADGAAFDDDSADTGHGPVPAGGPITRRPRA